MPDQTPAPTGRDAERWVGEGAFVECFSAANPADVVHRGRVVGYADAPTVIIETASGVRVSWMLGQTRRRVDLAARLLAAIDEAERRTRSAVQFNERRGCPHCGREVREFRWFDGDDSTEIHPCGHSFSTDALIEYGVALRVPDERVLSRCAAARRIVARHSAVGHTQDVTDRIDPDGTTWGHWIEYCRTCREPMPCPDLRDLADGYGLSIEEDTNAAG